MKSHSYSLAASSSLALALAFVFTFVIFTAPTAHAQKESVVYSFGASGDGFEPIAGAVDAKGNLYGTTIAGGSHSMGTVYAISGGKETILWNFTGGPDGGQPYGGLVRDPQGNLYGTTLLGGTHSLGTVYEITGPGVEKVLVNFDETHGATPYGGLIRDAATGNLYGVTLSGGAHFLGALYKITPDGTETVLYSFQGPPNDGADPEGQLMMDKQGNLYGQTLAGGTGKQGFCSSCGTIFEFSSAGVESVLYNFTGGTDGGAPAGGAFLISDSQGNLYGIASGGGIVNANCQNGCGVVFEFTPSSKAYHVLHSFTGGTTDGASPYSGLVRDGQGNLYGTTPVGGKNQSGTIYRVTAAGQERVIWNFGAPGDGASPLAALTPDGNGGAYGTTLGGGSLDLGAVYHIAP